MKRFIPNTRILVGALVLASFATATHAESVAVAPDDFIVLKVGSDKKDTADRAVAEVYKKCAASGKYVDSVKYSYIATRPDSALGFLGPYGVMATVACKAPKWEAVAP